VELAVDTRRTCACISYEIITSTKIAKTIKMRTSARAPDSEADAVRG
jgi:hypothetical protein